MEVEVIGPKGEPGQCYKCGEKGEWFKVEGLGFMGKNWLSSLQCGLCEKCFNVFEENKKKLDEQKRKDRELSKRSILLGGKRPALEFSFKQADPKLNSMSQRIFRDFNPSQENIFVFGGTGTSKTFFSTCVAREALDAGKKARVYNIRDLNAELREASMDGGEWALMDHLVSLDVLVIDDLGVGKINDFRIDGIMGILEKRDNALKRGLIVTSNIDLDGIAEVFSDRVSSRLRGMCKPPHGMVVEVKGTDARLKVI